MTCSSGEGPLHSPRVFPIMHPQACSSCSVPGDVIGKLASASKTCVVGVSPSRAQTHVEEPERESITRARETTPARTTGLVGSGLTGDGLNHEEVRLCDCR